MEKYHYKPVGTCSKEMFFTINDSDIVEDIKVIGGCPGNLLGLSKVCKGKKIDEIIELLSGIKCGNKPTSCPDQIAQALIKYKENKKVEVEV